MPIHASDLNEVHRVDHRRRGAVPSQGFTDSCQLAHARTEAAELGRHASAEQPMLLERVDGLVRKAPPDVDLVGVWASCLEADVPGLLQQLQRGGAHAVTSPEA